MSRLHYLRLYELLNRLPPQRIAPRINPPHIGRRPQRKKTGIYFMGEEGEIFTFAKKTFNRIVYVGINEKEGNLQKAHF
jgi:hypothetical protein